MCGGRTQPNLVLMSLHNDYAFAIVAKQSHAELLARAAEDHLARVVPRPTPWWRRLRCRPRWIGYRDARVEPGAC